VTATATEASKCIIYTKPLSATCSSVPGPALLGVPRCTRDQCAESPLAGSTIYQKEVFEPQLAVAEPTRQIMTYDIPDFKLVDAPDGCGFNEYMLELVDPSTLTDEDAKRRARLNPITTCAATAAADEDCDFRLGASGKKLFFKSQLDRRIDYVLTVWTLDLKHESI
jgi:hypothetical protein